MAKIKTTAILEEVSTSADNVNWTSQGEHNFEIGTLVQENGVEAVVTIPESASGKQFTYSEVKELYKAMAQADNVIGGE